MSDGMSDNRSQPAEQWTGSPIPKAEHEKVSLSRQKLDAGKVPIMHGAWLRFPLALEAVAKVSVFGAKKYKSPVGDMGYLEVEDGYRKYTEALGRHLKDEALEGFVNDKDGGVLHPAQAAWNALARLEKLLREFEQSGLPVPEPHYEDRSKA